MKDWLIRYHYRNNFIKPEKLYVNEIGDEDTSYFMMIDGLHLWRAVTMQSRGIFLEIIRSDTFSRYS